MRATPSVTLRVTNSRPRRGALVVEQDAATAEHVVALAVVDRDPVAVDLGHAVGAARVERRRSRSAAPRAPCRTSRSTTPGRSGSGLGPSSRIASSIRVTPMAVNSPVSTGCFQLVGTKLWPRGCRPRPASTPCSDVDDRELVEQVGLVQVDLAGEVVDPLEVLGAGPADDAVDLVALARAAVRPGSCRPAR